ncbi:MAG: DUF2247 family protein [Oscillospiraceae bacterium]|jgi:hypothetical protein|nr:DUF2247 family protein [Oscillospiraceae bacterium]
MNIFDFTNMNIRITWILLLIGFNSNKLLKNSEYEKKSISADEIINYAVGLLAESNDDGIISLAILKKEDEKSIFNALTKLSETEGCDYNFEFRKFRAMYIYQNMPSSSDEYIHGILKFSELWDKFGFPSDSPNIYFEFKNYSAEKFNTLLAIHKAWLKSEFEAIIAGQE